MQKKTQCSQRYGEAEFVKGKKKEAASPNPVISSSRLISPSIMGGAVRGGGAVPVGEGGEGVGNQSYSCPFHVCLQQKSVFQVLHGESITTLIRNFNGTGLSIIPSFHLFKHGNSFSKWFMLLLFFQLSLHSLALVAVGEFQAVSASPL